MDFYGRKNLWKLMLLICAVLIGLGTLWYTETFLKELRAQEVRRVEQFAQAMQRVLNAGLNEDITFEYAFLESNNTIPTILTDAEYNLILANNIDEDRLKDPKWVKEKIRKMSEEADPIPIFLSEGDVQYLYYQNSILLTKLRYYPLVLLLVISLFIVIAYVAFSNARKAEQDRVWNGLAKETAHQIGTPLTSLMGWLEYVRDKDVGGQMAEEMEKDINRLNTITQRFSKIGSKPALTPAPVVDVTRNAVEYLQARSPGKIKVVFEAQPEAEEVVVNLNIPLFEWVIENLIRNAIDAIEGTGEINISVKNNPKKVMIDVQDSGKGVPVNKQKAIFRPGFTTKSRGWGLGLSLAKRIIEDYHNGRIFVAQSEVGKGSIFRILLRK